MKIESKTLYNEKIKGSEISAVFDLLKKRDSKVWKSVGADYFSTGSFFTTFFNDLFISFEWKT